MHSADLYTNELWIGELMNFVRLQALPRSVMVILLIFMFIRVLPN